MNMLLALSIQQWLILAVLVAATLHALDALVPLGPRGKQISLVVDVIVLVLFLLRIFVFVAAASFRGQ